MSLGSWIVMALGSRSAATTWPLQLPMPATSKPANAKRTRFVALLLTASLMQTAASRRIDRDLPDRRRTASICAVSESSVLCRYRHSDESTCRRPLASFDRVDGRVDGRVAVAVPGRTGGQRRYPPGSLSRGRVPAAQLARGGGADCGCRCLPRRTDTGQHLEVRHHPGTADDAGPRDRALEPAWVVAGPWLAPLDAVPAGHRPAAGGGRLGGADGLGRGS